MTHAQQLLVLSAANEPGELRLLRAVLIDGLTCAIGRAGTTNRRAQIEARYWLASTRRKSPFDFELLAETLGLEPDAVRRRVEGY